MSLKSNKKNNRPNIKKLMADRKKKGKTSAPKPKSKTKITESFDSAINVVLYEYTFNKR